MKSFSLYQKFALTIILLGLLPMAILATFIANKMIRDYSLALRGQYEQAAGYVESSIESMLDSYNTVSKMPHFYNFGTNDAQGSYLSFDHFRQILYGEGYEPDTMEEDRKRDMGQFLQYIQSVDSYISGVHVIALDSHGEKQSFHYSVYNTFFLDPELFEETVDYEGLDKAAKTLVLVPPHTTAYFYGTPEVVFTAARNPHFLYNTLEIIRMTALEEEGREQVPEMIEALSGQIHYLIGPMQDMVPLEKEIDIVRKYIYLLNCRIGSKIQLMVNAQGGLRVQVPKLILQPIVENAYVHGIKPRKGKGCIMIETAVKGEQFEISVMDNGVGMDEEAIAKIQRLFESDDPGIKNEYNWQSIGLKNVHDRIRFLYGEAYGIRIISTPAVGTMVRILLPLQEIMEKDEEK